MYVKSETHFCDTLSAVKLRFNTFSDTGYECLESVVTLNFFLWTERNPYLRITRAIKDLETLPSAF